MRQGRGVAAIYAGRRYHIPEILLVCRKAIIEAFVRKFRIRMKLTEKFWLRTISR